MEPVTENRQLPDGAVLYRLPQSAKNVHVCGRNAQKPPCSTAGVAVCRGGQQAAGGGAARRALRLWGKSRGSAPAGLLPWQTGRFVRPLGAGRKKLQKTLAKGGGLAYITPRAEVVELVDTLGSGSSGGSSVGVRVSPSAPFLFV